MPEHPLLAFFEDAARGNFPAPDGAVTLVPPLPGDRAAIVCFTGHAVIATQLTLNQLGPPSPDGFGGALHPSIKLRIANGGIVGVEDVTLCAPGLGEASGIGPTTRWNMHPRVAYAEGLRSNVRVFGDDSGFVTISDGLGGRREMSVEVVPAFHDSGAGRRLIHAARQLTPVGAYVFAAVSPGNARSLRAFLSQGFVPIGSEVILTPAGAWTST